MHIQWGKILRLCFILMKSPSLLHEELAPYPHTNHIEIYMRYFQNKRTLEAFRPLQIKDCALAFLSTESGKQLCIVSLRSLNFSANPVHLLS